MAEAVAFRNNALPYPVYGVTWTVVFPLLDADGDPISPSSPDSERSLNGDTFADCTNEATEIATSTGICYLTLTAAEMTADIVAVRIQSTGAKTTVLTLYPRKLPILSTGTCQGANDTGDIQLASGDSAVDDTYNGCLVVAVIDSTTEARVINDYVGSTKTAEVAPAWNTAAPDNNDTYTIYLPEGRQVQQANTTHVGGTVQTARDIGASVLLSSGTGTGQLKLASGYVAVTWADIAAPTTTVNLSGTTIATTQKVDVETIKTNPVVNAGTVTFPTGATLASTTNITAGTITTVTTTTTATNVTTVNGLAANVITAASMAADASAEIADAVWDEDATGHQTQGTFGQAIGDPVADSNTIYGAVVTGAAGATVAADIIAVKAETASIQTDTNDIQTRIPAALGANGNIMADIRDSLGVAVTNSDFTIASATSTTVTLPTTYTNTASLPDDDRYIYCALSVVGGTGAGQVVLLTTAAASARQYNVVSGTMPVQLDNTSTCIVLDTWAGTAIADAVLSRNVSNVEATAGEHTLCTVVLAMLENDAETTPGSLIIYRTDGTTPHATKTLTSDATAEPITGIS